tara:strand:+ start:647 stop:781 length:135 start_codon:yes stop_codon:yes gene_type:complete
VWSIISNIDANAIDRKPNGIKMKLGRCLKFWNDFKAKKIGRITD